VKKNGVRNWEKGALWVFCVWQRKEQRERQRKREKELFGSNGHRESEVQRDRERASEWE